MLSSSSAHPSRRPSSASANPYHRNGPIQVRRKRGLEDRDSWFCRRQGTGTQNSEGAPRDAIPEVRPLDQFILSEAMEAAPPPQSLERDLGRRVLREEFEDLAVMIPQVVEGGPRGRVHGGRHHAGPAQGGGS